MSESQVVPVPGLGQPAADAALWSTYVLRRSDTGAVIYAGRSTQPEHRLRLHIKAARSPTHRHKRAISGLVYELSEQGIRITLEVVAESLSSMTAKTAEARLIQELLKTGAPLANVLMLDGGKGGVVIHSAPGSLGFAAAQREYHRERRRIDPEYREAHRVASRECHREQYATPEGRTRALAHRALTDLRKGGSLTPMRRHHITSAGRIEDAIAILAARGESWPRDGPMD